MNDYEVALTEIDRLHEVLKTGESIRRDLYLALIERDQARDCAKRAMRLAHHERVMQARAGHPPEGGVEGGEWAAIRAEYPWSVEPRETLPLPCEVSEELERLNHSTHAFWNHF